MAIKYLGSKRKLIPEILRAVNALAPSGTVIDLFSGTSRVGHALKARGYQVLANDHLTFAETIARCYVQADAGAWLDDAQRLVSELNRLPGRPGYFTETFCRESRFVHPKNGERVDAIRDEIARMALPPELEAVVLVALMEATDRVDSTTGVQMAYLKSWAPRASRDLELRVPELLPRARDGKGEAHGMEAAEAVAVLEGDVAYIDPPYNQHSYLGNYHVWETLVRWDAPEAYGTARKRIDCRTRKSAFNRKREFEAAFRYVVEKIRAPKLVVSFSDEGFLDRAAVESILSARGHVSVLAHDYKRYVGAQIGIHNPRGERVGTAGHLRNREFLFVVGPEAVSVGQQALFD